MEMGAQLAGEKNTALLFVRAPQMKIYDTTKTKEYELERFYEGRRERITRMIQVNMEKSLRHPCSQLGMNTVVCLQEQKAHAKTPSRTKGSCQNTHRSKRLMSSQIASRTSSRCSVKLSPECEVSTGKPHFSLFRLSRRQ